MKRCHLLSFALLVFLISLLVGCTDSTTVTQTATSALTDTVTSKQTEKQFTIPLLATINLELTSSTWIEGESYDVYSMVEEKLNKVGFRIIGQEDTGDAKLLINYEEEPASRYSSGAVGTAINCVFTLIYGNGGLLFEKKVSASTSLAVIGEGLYSNAVSNFKNQVYYKYLGEIIATRFGAGDEIEILISAALNDNDVTTRYTAIVALGEAGDIRAIAPLIELLFQGHDFRVRMAVVTALGQIGDASAIEALSQVLIEDEDQFVRSCAATALGQICDTNAVNVLITALMDEAWEVRAEAAEALGEIGDSRAVEALTQALDDEDMVVRYNAERALDKIDKLTK